jgi:hypothetical protein
LNRKEVNVPKEDPILGHDPVFMLVKGEHSRTSYRVWYMDGAGKVRYRTFPDQDIAIKYAGERPFLITVQQVEVTEIWNRERRELQQGKEDISVPRFKYESLAIARDVQKCGHCRSEMRGKQVIVYFAGGEKIGKWVHLAPCATELGYPDLARAR